MEELFFGPWMRVESQDSRRQMCLEESQRDQKSTQALHLSDQMNFIPPTLPLVSIRETVITMFYEGSGISNLATKSNRVEHLEKGKAIIVNTKEGQRKEFCIKKLFSVIPGKEGETLKGNTAHSKSLYHDLVNRHVELFQLTKQRI